MQSKEMCRNVPAHKDELLHVQAHEDDCYQNTIVYIADMRQDKAERRTHAVHDPRHWIFHMYLCTNIWFHQLTSRQTKHRVRHKREQVQHICDLLQYDQ
ncbi:hypothetical protein SERLADRAFT_403094 [Serpula lacrymans var. lacrymans S7.9]|uniref:Uncharacterized protein n=1 Tax=Serpula lacrymans var. lacrymans (strain S7.9) TaxID=578457 RepID=F8PCL9_SERL9|nr:uncharacterized protein SERLADRAFT_403094 [Serpula lacrymans var. lacrymans S7.9]EGO18971.1 hypothetical protein SERLADRAFT_403094 [Serpula lacrymans var. lacrymans S7.9]